MRHKLFIIILLVTCNLQFVTFYSFAQSWGYSSIIKSTEDPLIVDLKIDNNNNIYVGSYFMNMVSPISLSAYGTNDIFIAKYDQAGSVVWVKKFGGNNPIPTPPDYIDHSESLNGLYIDTLNSFLYATGIFYGTAQFGTTTITSYIPTSQSYFLMKLDLNGNVIWAKRMPINISGMITNNLGDLFFCGGKIGSEQIDSTHSISNGSCIVKFDPSGDCIWAKHISNDFFPRDIKLQNSNIFINCIASNDTVRVDTIVRYVPINTQWSLLVCFDINCNAKWVSLYGGISSQCGYDFSVDKNSNSYTTGYFTGTGYFGNDTLTANAGQKNMFLAKHDSLGHLLWTKQVHATSSLGNCVSNVVDSILYVTGWFKGSARFNDTVTAGSVQDMFLATYNTNGTCLGVKNFGKAEGRTVVQNLQNAAFLSGFFFSNINIGNNSYSPSGINDIFIAKLSGLTNVNNTSRLINTNNLLTIYANPNTGKCNITIPEEFQNEDHLTLQIFDTKGNQIQQAKIEMLDNKIKVNIEAEAKGIYNAVLTNGKKNYSGRIVFE